MKFMNMKRFASTVMAGVLTMSLAVPAMAADSQTVITATYAATTLDVVVPASTNATINPYGLPVTMEDGLTTISGQPITIPTPLTVQNQSSVALKMDAKIATTVENGMTLDTAAGSYDAESNKKLYVEFQAFETAFDGTTILDPTKSGPAWVGLKDDGAVLKVALDSTQSVDATAVVNGEDLILREGKDTLAQSGGVAFVRLSGKVAKKAAWATTDKLVATITYSFEPAVYSKSAGTLAGQAGATSINNGGNMEVTLTPTLPDNVSVTTWTWASSDEATATVVAKADTKTATVTNKLATSGTTDTNVDITVSGVGSDGITYSATITLSCKGNP